MTVKLSFKINFVLLFIVRLRTSSNLADSKESFNNSVDQIRSRIAFKLLVLEKSFFYKSCRDCFEDSKKYKKKPL